MLAGLLRYAPLSIVFLMKTGPEYARRADRRRWELRELASRPGAALGRRFARVREGVADRIRSTEVARTRQAIGIASAATAMPGGQRADDRSSRGAVALHAQAAVEVEGGRNARHVIAGELDLPTAGPGQRRADGSSSAGK